MSGFIWRIAAGYLSLILGVIFTSAEFKNPIIIIGMIGVPILACVLEYHTRDTFEVDGLGR